MCPGRGIRSVDDMITAEGLTKRFGAKTAVDHLDFTVHPGRVTGFLGPNGAGQVDHHAHDRRTRSADRGHRHRQRRTVRRGIRSPLHEVGALLDAKAVHTGRTAENHLLAMAATHGIGRRRVREVIELTGLESVARKRVGGFSLGMGQRLGIAAALLGDPQTLLFDEPVNGLDPEGVLWVRQLVRNLAAEGRTIFLSRHLMSEMALTADHLIVLGRGRIIADAPVADIIARRHRSRVHVRSPHASQLADLLAGPDITVTRVETGLLEVTGLDASAQSATSPPGTASSIHELTPQHALARGGLHGPHRGRRRIPYGGTPMTTTTTTPTASRPAPRTPTTSLSFGGVLRSEWIKLRSLRSTVWSYASVVAIVLGLALVLALTTVSGVDGAPDTVGGPAEAQVGLLVQSSTFGVFLAQLVVAVLGVLVISGEYGTGMSRSTFTAVPKRLPVLAAKAAVLFVVTFLVGVIATVGAYVVSSAVYSAHDVSASLTDPDLFMPLLGASLYLALVAVFSLGVGTMVRSSAGGIGIVLALILVVPTILQLVPADWAQDIHPYLLSTAGTNMFAPTEITGTETLTAWQDLLVVLGWVAASTAGAAVLLTKRDA